jgi:peptidyl-tRNA hydrolase, PTH1 family
LVVLGLGNPGALYARTRHNVGFLVLDHIARLGRASEWKRRKHSRFARVGELVLVKPSTFMNLSGDAALEISRALGVPVSDLLVVYDDMDLETGRIRIRQKGSSGGHKGLQSIIDTMGTNEIARIRVGIGRPPGNMDPVDYVLRRPSGPEREELLAGVSAAALAVDFIAKYGIDAAMARYNGNPVT